MRRPGAPAGPPERRAPSPWARASWPIRAVAALALVMAGAAQPGQAANPCADCHGEQVTASSRGPHAGIAGRETRFCESCHANAVKHLASGSAADIRGKVALRKWSAKEKAMACLSCHRGQIPAWEGTPHARSKEVSCWSCHGDAGHDAKGNPVARRGETACASCHVEQVSQFRRVYHHPVPEGRMSCASCHDVHGKDAAATRRIEAKCLSCHPEAAGPYVFPHRALEDGCSSCHTPHGSVNRGLLRTAGNGTCLSCHVQSNFPAVGNVPHNRMLQGGGKCLDCHSEVHGSNVDPLMAPQYRKR